MSKFRIIVLKALKEAEETRKINMIYKNKMSRLSAGVISLVLLFAQPIEAKTNRVALHNDHEITAKYDGAVSPLERYAISTFGDSGVKILRNVPITNTSYAGVIPRALNSSTESKLEDARDANFLLDQNANYYDTKCSTDEYKLCCEPL